MCKANTALHIIFLKKVFYLFKINSIVVFFFTSLCLFPFYLFNFAGRSKNAV